MTEIINKMVPSEEKAVEKKDEALTDDEKFLEGLNEKEAAYIIIKTTTPDVSIKDGMMYTGTTRNEYLKMESKTSLQTYITRKRRKELETYLDVHTIRAAQLSDLVTEEIMRRFQEAKLNPTSAADLFKQGYNEKEAKLILDSRVEGLKVKDLAKIFNDIPTGVSRIRQEAELEQKTSDHMDEIASRFNKYEAKILNINIEHFSPEQTTAFDAFNGVRSHEIIEEDDE